MLTGQRLVPLALWTICAGQRLLEILGCTGTFVPTRVAGSGDDAGPAKRSELTRLLYPRMGLALELTLLRRSSPL